MAAVAAAAEAGTLRVDDELHLTPLAAEEEDPQVAKLRAALDRWIGEAGAGADSCGCHSIVRIGDSPGEFALHERRTTPCSRRSVRLRREGLGSGPIGVLARRAGPGGNRIVGSPNIALHQGHYLFASDPITARATMTAKGGRCLESLEAVRLFLGEAIRFSEAGGLLARRRMPASMTS
jgi:hypothetical protein